MSDVGRRNHNAGSHYLAKHYEIVVFSSGEMLVNERCNEMPIFNDPRKQALQQFQWLLAQHEPS